MQQSINEDIGQKIELIRRNDVLSRLDSMDCRELANMARWQIFEKSEMIWNEGKDVPWFGLIEAGFVKMVKLNQQGRETTLEVMGPGQTFGCLGTIEGSGCPLAAVSVSSSTILKISKLDFLRKYENCIPLQKEMLKISTRRLFAKLSMMAKLTTGRVDSRIANVILMLSESYGAETPNGLKIGIPLTRQDLSDFTGITLESAIRTLSAWQKKGIVTSQNSFITIVKLNELTAIAGSS